VKHRRIRDSRELKKATRSSALVNHKVLGSVGGKRGVGFASQKNQASNQLTLGSNKASNKKRKDISTLTPTIHNT
jgi:hypothetical protein